MEQIGRWVVCVLGHLSRSGSRELRYQGASCFPAHGAVFPPGKAQGGRAMVADKITSMGVRDDRRRAAVRSRIQRGTEFLFHPDWRRRGGPLFQEFSRTNQPVSGSYLQTDCEDSVMRCQRSNRADRIPRSQPHAMCFANGHPTRSSAT